MRAPGRQIGTLIALLLAAQTICGASQDVRAVLAKLPAGKRIEVVLNGGDRLIGHLGSVEADRFVLEPDKRSGSSRVLRFEEVGSVKGKMTVVMKWAIAGAIWGVLVFLGSLV